MTLRTLLLALFVTTHACGAADPAASEGSSACAPNAPTPYEKRPAVCTEEGSNSSCPADIGGRYLVRCRRHSTLSADFDELPRPDCMRINLLKDEVHGVADGLYCCPTQPRLSGG